MTGALTDDGFLGGRLRIAQPAQGYRAGVDPVFLAAAVPAKAGERVLDLGCGVGTAALCLAARVPGLVLYGLELQEVYAALAERNAAANGIAMTVVRGDVVRMPAALKAESFDHVLMNPPYFDGARRSAARDSGRETALAGEADMGAWCDAALRRLRPGGMLSVIQVPERLPDLLHALTGRAAIRLHPLAPREGRDASRILLLARKGGAAPLSLAAPTLLHRGATHERDGENYTDVARKVLRDGEPWPWTRVNAS